MGGTRGFRTHEGILADVLVTAWILFIGMAVVAVMGHWEVALVLGVLFTLNVWLAVGTARSDAKDIAMLRGLVTDWVKEIVRLRRMCQDRQQSGLIDLDSFTTGWQPGNLIIVGGRPSMGKSAFAQGVAEHAAKQGYGVLFITLEMTPESLMERAYARTARVSADRLRKGAVHGDEWSRISKAMHELSQLKAWTFGPVGPTPGRIKAAVRKLQRESRCDLVVVDYLQLLTSESRPDQRYLEIGQYSRAFKWLALEFRIPVIVLSQLSRSAESTSDKRPTLQHLRESGNIEQDADVVMFLWREDYYKPETDRKGITECIIAKQRHGPVGTVELRWNPEYVTFENLAKEVPA